MSFEVRSKSPMDDEWEAREEEIALAAGNFGTSQWSGSGMYEGGMRDHGWLIETFEDAQELKRRLELVEGVTVTVREQ